MSWTVVPASQFGAQTARWEPIYDYAFSRMGTQFFAAPVPAMRAIRGALKPGGELRKVCWQRKSESPMWAATEQVVQRFLTDERARLTIAARGQRLANNHHTYTNRMRQLAQAVMAAPPAARLADLLVAAQPAAPGHAPSEATP